MISLDDAKDFAVTLESFGKTENEIKAGKLINSLIKDLDKLKREREALDDIDFEYD